MNDTEKHKSSLVGPIERFDPQTTMFVRALKDPAWTERGRRFYGPSQINNKAGHSHLDFALRNGAWAFEEMYLREGSDAGGFPMPEGSKVDAADPCELTRQIKWAARFFGASLVGICELDRRWLYANPQTEGQRRREVPPEYRFVVAMAIEMDFDLIQTSPAGGAATATGLGYSKMAIVSSMLAQFIRDMGYQAIPSGNDSALSIPIAIEAGLGELGRNGILVTEKYGPRVRLCKVFTDLPLVPDAPRFFGVKEFCDGCMICAQDCPSRAITFGKETTEGPTISNNPGVHKWFINPEQCFKYWIANGLDCSNCIRVCPFNQRPGWHHDLVRASIKRTPALNPLFLWFHKILGYGNQADPGNIWESQ